MLYLSLNIVKMYTDGAARGNPDASGAYEKLREGEKYYGILCDI